MHQVLRDVITDINVAQDVGDAQAEVAAGRHWGDLAHYFLHGHGARKPTKKHRLKVFAWLRSTNNALKTVLGIGWSKFKVDDLKHIRTASSMTLAVDQGSDGWSAGQFLLDSSYNVCLLGDLSHRLWNDSRLALSDAGIRHLMTATTVAMNSDHGPWKEQRWFNSLREAAVEFSASRAPSKEMLQFFTKDLLREVCGEDAPALVSFNRPPFLMCTHGGRQGRF